MDPRLYEDYARIQGEHWWFLGRRRIIGGILGRHLEGDRGSGRRILDVGCGTGGMLAELRRFGTVEGVDTEPAAVELCHRRGELAVRLAPENELPYPDGSFELVTLLDVIEHAKDDQTLLAEVGRVLVPGGLALVSVPAYMWMWDQQDELAHHYRRYTRPRLLASLALAGFEPVRATYFNTILFPPVAAVRLARRLRPRPAEPGSDFDLTRPGRTNTLLARVFGSEALWLARANLPFGVSVVALVRRR